MSDTLAAKYSTFFFLPAAHLLCLLLNAEQRACSGLIYFKLKIATKENSKKLK